MADSCHDPAFTTNTAPLWMLITNKQREAEVRASNRSEKVTIAVQEHAAGRGPGKQEKSELSQQILALYQQGFARREIVETLKTTKAKVKGALGRAVEAGQVQSHAKRNKNQNA